MKVIFISDAHLKNLSDSNYKTILNFLDSLTKIDILVVLGDLFDFWNGNNKIAHEYYKPVLDKLLHVKNSGTKIIYLEGNHDFFMGRFFTEILNADVYSNSAEILLDNKRVFMAHGDMVNKKDYGYRVLRWFLRSWFMRIVFYITPSSAVWKIASFMSRESRTNLIKDFNYEKIFADYATEKWKEGYDIVLLGHCHNPKILKQDLDGREVFYINPGDWINHFTYVVYENKEFKLNMCSR